MITNIEHLYSIAHKRKRNILGLMSGTSLDGLDVAMCAIEGSGKNTTVNLLHFETIAYDADFKQELRTIFSREEILLEKLCLLNEWIGTQHAAIINHCLQKWKLDAASVDCIASHGQTVYHAPLHQHRKEKFGNASLQIGDADQIAVHTGIITLSDFRQKHIAAGGEGAPLAAYGDFLLFGEKEEDVLLINIGGISNFTFLPAGAGFDEIISSDIGPGNTLMDAFVQRSFPGKYYDNNAAIASTGNINTTLLNALKHHPFFAIPFPKTTGPEVFNLEFLDTALQVSSATLLPVEDVLATLNAFTGAVIVQAIRNYCKDKSRLYISGGGLHNPLLMDHIRKEVPHLPIRNTIEKNIHPDAKEAVLFAVLANECLSGNKESYGKGSKNFPATTMGKISLPD
ncbi:MAG: anhydro-N-acetylmuramic acid kinase [Bacteroidetes bacterium]|nr:anhydro-N-acetylmuramic acid kinase [Bacteroidota bacterium]